MGLDLQVGILPCLQGVDSEGFEYFSEQLNALSDHMASLGMPKHVEPEECEMLDCEMFGYSGLHYLRRVAAHLDTYKRLPDPGTDEASEDPVLEAYFKDVIGDKGPLLKRLFGRGQKYAFQREFDHLIVHSDAEGFYLPIEFAEVVFPPDDLQVPGAMVGSVPRLLNECDRLRDALEIPKELHAQSDALWEAVESQGQGQATWERYGIESFTCVGLIDACEHSMKTGAAVVFT